MFSPKSNVRVTAGVYKGKSGVVVHETPRKLKLKLDDGVTTGLVTHTHTQTFRFVRSGLFFKFVREIFLYSIIRLHNRCCQCGGFQPTLSPTGMAANIRRAKQMVFIHIGMSISNVLYIYFYLLMFSSPLSLHTLAFQGFRHPVLSWRHYAKYQKGKQLRHRLPSKITEGVSINLNRK